MSEWPCDYLDDIREALGAEHDEMTEDAAKRVVRERDEARRQADRLVREMEGARSESRQWREHYEKLVSGRVRIEVIPPTDRHPVTLLVRDVVEIDTDGDAGIDR